MPDATPQNDAGPDHSLAIYYDADGIFRAPHDVVRGLEAEVERLREDMRREVAAAEERGYAAGYSDGLTDMGRRYDPNA